MDFFGNATEKRISHETHRDQRLQEALAECEVELDEEQMMNLTMAQVSGIVLTSGSSDGSDTCQEVEAIALDS